MRNKLLVILLTILTFCCTLFIVGCESDNTDNSVTNNQENTETGATNGEQTGTEGGEQKPDDSNKEPEQKLATLKYELSADGTYYICTGMEENSGSDVVIPATYEGKPVKEIGKDAFKDNVEMRKVIISNGIEKIGESAFAWDKVQYGNGLLEVEIPASVKSISGGAFYFSRNLRKVNYLGTIDEWCAIEFEDMWANPIYTCPLYINNKIQTVITINADSVNAYAFYNASFISKVTLTENVKSIGDYAFLECEKLVEVVNKSSLTITAGAADNGLIGVKAKQVVSDESASKIVKSGDYIFYNDNGNYSLVNYGGATKEITLPDNINGNNYKIEKAFYSNLVVESVVIPNSVTDISAFSFCSCYNLQKVVIGDGVQEILDSTFYACRNLMSVTLGSNLSSISCDIPDGLAPFMECYRLVEVINKSNLNITVGSEDNGRVGFYAKQIVTTEPSTSNFVKQGDYIFYRYDGKYHLVNYIGNEAKITLPTSINGNNYNINENAFCSNYFLLELTISAGVEDIGDLAFMHCENLKNVEIDRVKSMEGAFYSCSSLTNVTIGDDVANIGVGAFMECSSLTTVKIGKGVKTIGRGAFYWCHSLTSVTFEDTSTWYYTSTEDHNFTGGTQIDVTNSTTNATYLTDTYDHRYWYKV